MYRHIKLNHMALASKIRIEIEGNELKDFINLTINQSIYTHHDFEVVCRMDTFEEKDSFVMEVSKKYIGSAIGITIESSLKVRGESHELFFKGLITSVRTARSYTGDADQVILSGYSPDILMDDNPGCYSFENKTIKQVADEILKPYPKDILKSKVDPVKDDRLTYVVQYNESRYEFLQRMSARYGEWFFYDGTRLILGTLPDIRADLRLGYDLTDFGFSIRMNPLKFRYVSYDSTAAGPVEASSTANGGKEHLNRYGKIAHDVSMKAYEQLSTVYCNNLNVPDNNYRKELGQVVSLGEGASALGMSVMSGSSQNPKLRPGTKVNIKALKVSEEGEVDYGEYLITAVSHTCSNTMNFSNTFEGIPAEAKIPDYTDPHRVPYCDSQIAVVKDNDDPDKLGRVRVRFFWQGDNMLSPWLRPVNAYSGPERGLYFIPEIDDEVLVGFEGGNAEKPYLIGSLYNGKNKPPASWPEKENSFKGIMTRSKLLIAFDDKKKITTIETPGGNKVVLNDEGKSILLHDMNSNKVELTAGGITLESAKDISILSDGRITMESKGVFSITSKGNTSMKGTNVDINADVGLTARGTTTAELSASGQTTIKGAMVMIN